MESLKREILELLDKDLEFRYAVAGYLGLSEVLKRLDSITEEQKNLRKEQTKIWRETASIREEQVRLREDFNKLREDFNEMLAVIGRVDTRLSRVEKTLEKLTIDVEDEAKSVVKHKLKEIGINVDLTSLILPDLELNVYGTSDDICVIGEATVRAGAGLVDELLNKLNKLRENHPERLRKNIILVIYASLPMIELIEKAKEARIWLLKAAEEFYRPEELFLKL